MAQDTAAPVTSAHVQHRRTSVSFHVEEIRVPASEGKTLASEKGQTLATSSFSCAIQEAAVPQEAAGGDPGASDGQAGGEGVCWGPSPSAQGPVLGTGGSLQRRPRSVRQPRRAAPRAPQDRPPDRTVPPWGLPRARSFPPTLTCAP